MFLPCSLCSSKFPSPASWNLTSLQRFVLNWNSLFFIAKTPRPFPLWNPYFGQYSSWPYLGHFQGSNCVVDVHEAIFFGLHLCKKIAPSIFWLFVFLMFVNLYRSQRSCKNLLKYPAWKYLLKEHAPHFSLKCVQTCKQSLMLVPVKKVFISLKIFISLNESKLW